MENGLGARHKKTALKKQCAVRTVAGAPKGANDVLRVSVDKNLAKEQHRCALEVDRGVARFLSNAGGVLSCEFSLCVCPEPVLASDRSIISMRETGDETARVSHLVVLLTEALRA